MDQNPQTSAPKNSNYPVSVDVTYPASQSRLYALVTILTLSMARILLLLPFLIVLYFLAIALWFAAAINYFVIVFTGKSSPGLHKFMVGYLRWSARFSAYMFGLTDKYPPFSLSE